MSNKNDAIRPPIKLILVLDKRDDKNAGVISKITSHGTPPNPDMRNGT